ncbi:MAG: glycosyltransferase family 2 protein [Pedobacter sp.]|uniref:glycosyltransferase family 2 protein n=1 Tax=Pedobacter sp. TaxID=1411316 RepID=UPI0035681ED3
MLNISPKISIITVNYNNKTGLAKTIQSVVNQSYSNIEYIVIDGGSADGSKGVIKAQERKIAYWISEADSGIYNAMNKGIKDSTGEYLLFINSGDVLVNENIIQEVVDLGLTADLVYGNLVFVNGDKRREWFPTSELTFNVFFRESIPHPSTFIKRTLFDTVGLYNEHYAIVSDWEFFVLAVCKFNCSFKHIDKFIALFNEDGISSGADNYTAMKKERDKVMKEHFPLLIKDYEAFEKLEKEMKKIEYFINARVFVKKMLKSMKLGPKCF